MRAEERIVDLATLEALLRVHGELELEPRLRRLAEEVLRLAGKDRGWVVTPSEEPGGPPAVQALGPSSPEPATAGALDDLETWTEEERSFVGEGRFGGVGPLLAFPVRGESGPAEALLLVPDAPPLPQDVRLAVRRFVHLARGAVGQSLKLRAVRALVILDDTAACYNRRYFDQFLQEELARATRFRAPLSLIFFDMDNLKQVNNLLGHTMGSRTLWEVSSRVRGKVRKFDKLFRFGGDEFCIVLPETEWHGALEVAERVREAIASRNFLIPEVPGGEGIRVTASFGISSFPLHARSKEELVVRADRAMQQIKSGPKNSIGVSELVGDPRAGV
ncbi:MAG TPA: GGDEF domain-containing protein [Candidatus Polarisedimenticolaceae bacterium]|nr:GGDEF domain-containing protein [Candidatus Polarisedimenticolaceae bacterium]